MSRAKNAKRNGIWQGVYESVSLGFPFFVKRLIIVYLGSNYLGLNAFFASILGFLNIFDLGIGNAIVFAMYKPIAENENKKICALINTFKKINFIIGTIIFFFGLFLMPFLELFIKSGIPDGINIRILFLIYLLNISCSYFVYGHQINLLLALQRNDIVKKIESFLTVILYIIEIVVIITTKNFYIYEFLILLNTISRGVLANRYVKKHYPQFYANGDIDKETKNIIKNKTLGLFASKVASLSKNSFDSIVISTFIGLGTLAVFNNYYLILTSAMHLLNIVTMSIVSVVGNSIVVENSEKNFNDFRRLNFLLIILITICASLMINLYQPFIKLWVGAELQFDVFTMIMFPVYYFFLAVTQIQNVYIDAGGLWDKKKKYALAEAFTNITLNIAFCYIIGVKGIILASIVTIIIFDLYIYAKILFKSLFNQSFTKHIIKQTIYIFIGLVTIFVSFILLSKLSIENVLVELSVLSILSCLIALAILTAVYCGSEITKESIKWILEIFDINCNSKYLK